MEEKYSLLVLLLISMSSVRQCLGGQINPLTIKEIIPENYNMYEPPKIDGQPTKVIIRMSIVNIRSVDESKMSFQTDIVLQQSWKDNRLVYPARNKNSSKIVLDLKWRDLLWTPDTFFKNSMEGKVQNVIIPYMYIWLKNDSTIFFSSRLSVLFSCEMDLRRFPHDTQMCPIQLMSLTSTTEDMVLEWLEDDGFELTNNLMLPQFDIVGVSLENCTKSYSIGNFSCLKGVMNLERRSGYYTINVYIPSILIVLMSMLTFWIPPEAVPARVTLGVTSLLTIVTKQYQSSIPSVSYVVAMNVWMSSCIAFVFCGLLEYAVVLWVVRKKSKSKCLHPVHPETPSDDKPSTASFQIESPIREAKHWHRHFTAKCQKLNLDHISRVVFPLAFVLHCILYWTKYNIKAEPGKL